MRILIALALVLTASVGAAGEMELNYGPPASPVACPVSKSAPPAQTAELVRALNFIGAGTKQPASVEIVTLYDMRPFGVEVERPVVLARYDAVTVQSPNGGVPASVNLSVAVDPETSELICAFTVSAERWVESSLELGEDIETRAHTLGWTTTAIRPGGLQSTVAEVIEATWKRFGVDPETAGQIIIRPRFVANRYPADEIDGELVPRFPPGNVWIVEVVGTAVMERYVFGQNRMLTTLVAQFRDGDLKAQPGMILP